VSRVCWATVWYCLGEDGGSSGLRFSSFSSSGLLPAVAVSWRVIHYCSLSSRTPTCICGSVVAGENVAFQPKITGDR